MRNGDKKEKGKFTGFRVNILLKILIFRHFPTAVNVLRKKELQEKREQQGDVADTPLYRYLHKNGSVKATHFFVSGCEIAVCIVGSRYIQSTKSTRWALALLANTLYKTRTVFILLTFVCVVGM